MHRCRGGLRIPVGDRVDDRKVLWQRHRGAALSGGEAELMADCLASQPVDGVSGGGLAADIDDERMELSVLIGIDIQSAR